ncbi:MAG: 2-C-methyl-D-erythritol 2,4-cyclodiphosphate synthase [Clostridiales bacterium]|nr:2-C-methyl-D-erythritol 2,4-cyclodiphosphate synthase [Clostridiales bacterium]
MYKDKYISVIIAAAGTGTRMGLSTVSKQFRKIGGKPILAHAIEVFEKNKYIDEILVVLKKEDISYFKENILVSFQYNKISALVEGGSERQDSIHNAIVMLDNKSDIVLIHDGVRPFIEETSVNMLIQCLEENDAAAIGVPLKDTIKMIEDDTITFTPDRKNLFAVQTPQGFKKDILIKAYDKAYSVNYYGTDDTVLVERIGIPVKTVQGSYRNIKITTEEDITIANSFIENKGEKINMRIGIGMDVHRLTEGRQLILGGVEIEHHLGLLGHSDADVLLHAIMDALLGACALGDIGKQFPDTDIKYKGISSLELLKEVRRILADKNYKAYQIDSVIAAQKPKLAPYIDKMRENIARVLDLDINQIGIKATTTEGLGFCGREEGIAVQAVATVVKVSGL